ncbi:MAG: hypothetical protein HQK52_20665 [Oligoflexia bacterium]|nr:hypothetical protein [Oligoflexia bacterium]
MRKYHVYCNNEFIGESDLENEDGGMGVRIGVFFPNSVYSKYRSIFQIFYSATQEQNNEGLYRAYYAARDSLGLYIVSTENDLKLNGTVHIYDFCEDDKGYLLVPYKTDKTLIHRLITDRYHVDYFFGQKSV